MKPNPFSSLDRVGRIAEGFRADLILLDANPLEDLDNTGSILGVVRDGRWISRGEINRRLEAIAGRYE